MESKNNSIKYLKNFDDLLNYKVIIIEGYEMVGKSTFIESLPVVFGSDYTNNHVKIYRPSYESIKYDEVIGKGNRVVLGMSVLDYFYSNSDYMDTLIMDRGIVSSIVYRDMYNQDSGLTDDVVDNYIDFISKVSPVIVYINHLNDATAKYKYDKSVEEREVIDQYDKFNTFEEYYESYKSFDNKFKEVISRLSNKIPSYIVTW